MRIWGQKSASQKRQAVKAVHSENFLSRKCRNKEIFGKKYEEKVLFSLLLLIYIPRIFFKSLLPSEHLSFSSKSNDFMVTPFILCADIFNIVSILEVEKWDKRVNMDIVILKTWFFKRTRTVFHYQHLLRCFIKPYSGFWTALKMYLLSGDKMRVL